jgi:hypothetical protein
VFTVIAIASLADQTRYHSHHDDSRAHDIHDEGDDSSALSRSRLDHARDDCFSLTCILDLCRMLSTTTHQSAHPAPTSPTAAACFSISATISISMVSSKRFKVQTQHLPTLTERRASECIVKVLFEHVTDLLDKFHGRQCSSDRTRSCENSDENMMVGTSEANTKTGRRPTVCHARCDS